MAESTEGSGKPPRKRGPGKPFQKGQSGNPGGRPKDAEATRELARKYTRLAVNTLAKICKHGDKDSARVAAATAILDRGWGRPPQTLNLSASKGGILVKLPPIAKDPGEGK